MIVISAIAVLLIVVVVYEWARCGPDEDLF